MNELQNKIQAIADELRIRAVIFTAPTLESIADDLEEISQRIEEARINPEGE